MRFFLLLCFLWGLTLTAVAQREIDEEATWSFRDRAYTGIGFGGLSFGSHRNYGNYFSIGAGLLGGYMVTQNLSAGVGFEYQYTSYSSLKLRNHLYGGYPFIRYNIKNFFIQADYDLYSVQVDIRRTSEREMAERFFMGVGFSSPAGERAFMNFLVSYDFLYTNSSIFSSPLNTRLFFTF
jgi:hypothetical protein